MARGCDNGSFVGYLDFSGGFVTVFAKRQKRRQNPVHSLLSSQRLAAQARRVSAPAASRPKSA
jgi:hypothetical protein